MPDELLSEHHSAPRELAGEAVARDGADAPGIANAVADSVPMVNDDAKAAARRCLESMSNSIDEWRADAPAEPIGGRKDPIDTGTFAGGSRIVTDAFDAALTST